MILDELFPGADPEPGDAFASDQIELMVIANAKDIGGFEVRRALPTAKRRLVGPFIFFDRMGPAVLRAGQALDVRPHPHIGLSTVTYLFDGKIRHRDSLGTEMVIAPGDVNLMTAGRGIVHSERTPRGIARRADVDLRPADMAGAAGRQGGGRAGLREHGQRGAAGFRRRRRCRARRHRRLRRRPLAGARQPPKRSMSTSGSTRAPAVKIPADAEERAIYVLDGKVSISGDRFAENRLLVFRPGDEIVVSSELGAHFMLFGGASLGSKRYIWWNFVSSSKERIEQAKEEWKTGRFDIVPGDEEEYIPLPED